LRRQREGAVGGAGKGKLPDRMRSSSGDDDNDGDGGGSEPERANRPKKQQSGRKKGRQDRK